MLVGLLVAVIILIVLITLAVRPGLAEHVNEILDKIRDRLTALALMFLGAIQSFWNLENREKRETRWLKNQVRKEVTKRAKKMNISDRDIATALDLPLTESLVANPSSQTGVQAPQTPYPGYPPSQTGVQAPQTPYPGYPPSQTGSQIALSALPSSAKPDDVRTVLAIRKQVQEEYGMTADGQAEPPSNQDKVTAWSIRFVYIALVFVCIAADYVFTSSRAPTIIGGGDFKPPEFLRGLFQMLPVITGVLFVAIAALSGMLIDEFIVSHSNYIKIWPYIHKAMRIIGLTLAVVMFVVDVIAVIFLVIVGFAFSESLGLPLYTVLIVLVSIAIVIALGVLLAFPGLWQGLSALGLLIFGGVAALIAYALALVVVIMSAIVSLMGEINRLIWSRGSEKIPTSVNADTRNLAIVGYGNVASSWAVELCKQFATLYGPHIWLVGTSQTDREHVLQRNVARQVVRAYDVSPRDSAAANSKAIVQNLLNNYSGKRKEEVKPLLWIVRDEELDRCLDDLEQMGSPATNPSIKNVQLVLLWIVGPGASASPKMRSLAADLEEWAQKENSILATVIVYETESPASRWGAQRDPLFVRGLASLLGAGVRSPENSFSNAVAELRKSGYTFSYLAAGSIGVDPAQQNFQTGFVSGRAGEINPINASDRVGFLAGEVLKEQNCSTVPDRAMDEPSLPVTNDEQAVQKYQNARLTWLQQQAKVFVNIVVPTSRKALKQRQRFNDEISERLRRDFGVYDQHVAVVPVSSDKDHGIDIKAQWQLGAGDYYFLLTALRGVVDASSVDASAVDAMDANQPKPITPQHLRQGVKSIERSKMLATLYPARAVPATAIPATGGATGNGAHGANTNGGASSMPSGGAYPPPPFTPSPANSGTNGNAGIMLAPTQPGSNLSGYQDPNSYGYRGPTSGAYPDGHSDANSLAWDSSQRSDQQGGSGRSS